MCVCVWVRETERQRQRDRDRVCVCLYNRNLSWKSNWHVNSKSIQNIKCHEYSVRPWFSEKSPHTANFSCIDLWKCSYLRNKSLSEKWPCTYEKRKIHLTCSMIHLVVEAIINSNNCAHIVWSISFPSRLYCIASFTLSWKKSSSHRDWQSKQELRRQCVCVCVGGGSWVCGFELCVR